MSAENETHEQIVAEVRFHAQQDIDAEKDKPEFGILTAEGKIALNYADELEAAHKREVEKLNSVIQATVSRSDAEIDRLRREAEELRKQIGNSAKLREAIAKCVNLITEFGNAEIVKTPLDVIVDIEAILKAALVHSYDSDGNGPGLSRISTRFASRGKAAPMAKPDIWTRIYNETNRRMLKRFPNSASRQRGHYDTAWDAEWKRVRDEMHGCRADRSEVAR